MSDTPRPRLSIVPGGYNSEHTISSRHFHPASHDFSALSRPSDVVKYPAGDTTATSVDSASVDSFFMDRAPEMLDVAKSLDLPAGVANYNQPIQELSGIVADLMSWQDEFGADRSKLARLVNYAIQTASNAHEQSKKL